MLLTSSGRSRSSRGDEAYLCPSRVEVADKRLGFLRGFRLARNMVPQRPRAPSPGPRPPASLPPQAVELKDQLRKRGLRLSGNKAEMSARLEEALGEAA